MSSQVQALRLTKELMSMERDPPPGIICHPVDDADMTHLEAYIKGPPDSPYEKGTFRLDIHIPSEYPFSPPTIRFKTMIYHPNVDDSGTICLNILKKSENDGWKPSLNIEASLKSIQVLMGEPNPNDPLDPEIKSERICSEICYRRSNSY
ncbi:ubiquitin-conjugating enzyme E2 T [Circinella umbellata]|nr:ubiquitin-conjugating enzyme E2 T [Circinella umbellata]